MYKIKDVYVNWSELRFMEMKGSKKEQENQNYETSRRTEYFIKFYLMCINKLKTMEINKKDLQLRKAISVI